MKALVRRFQSEQGHRIGDFTVIVTSLRTFVLSYTEDSQDTAPGYLQLVPVPTYHKVNGATSQLKYWPGNMIN